MEVNEKMQNLPSAFQKKQTHETEGTKAKAEITVQKESGTDSAAPERERFKKQPEESANLFSFLNILGKSFSSLANSITSKISLFFS